MHIKYFHLLSFLAILFISGCATQPFVPVYNQPEFIGFDEGTVHETIEKVNLKNYTIGINKSCYVGEEIVHTEASLKRVREKPVYAKYRALLDSTNIKKGSQYDVKGKSYSNNSQLYIQLFESGGNFQFLKINTDGSLVTNHLYDWNGQISANDYVKSTTNKVFEKINESSDREEFYLKGSSSYSILYNGKDGNAIKLQYREYKDDMARVAFYQDLTYDLKESKIIRFRNFKIEVLKATNEGIEYKVLQD